MQLSMFLSTASAVPFLNSLLIISQRILFVNCFSKLFQKVFYGFSEEFSEPPAAINGACASICPMKQGVLTALSKRAYI